MTEDQAPKTGFFGAAPPPPSRAASQADASSPKTRITTLPSGMRVATQETYMPMTSLGLVVDAGSRHSFAEVSR